MSTWSVDYEHKEPTSTISARSLPDFSQSSKKQEDLLEVQPLFTMLQGASISDILPNHDLPLHLVLASSIDYDLYSNPLVEDLSDDPAAPMPFQHVPAPEMAAIQRTPKEAESLSLGKNSNCIKKIGRIILDRENLKEYKRPGEINQGLQRMLRSIKKKVGDSEGVKDQGDRFNTKDLRLLFQSENQEEVRHNLKVTHRILRRRMREQVLGSTQVKLENKLLYLISLKCSCLRMGNKSLAWRQEIPTKFSASDK